MANANSTAFVSKSTEGLKVEEYSWANVYRGTEAAFIESGLIRSEWLPGKPGNAKVRVSIGLVNGEMRVLPARSFPTADQENKGFITIRKTTRGRFEAWIYCLKKEREKREEAEGLERAKKRTEEAHKEIDKNIAELPTNPDAFIRNQLHTIRSLTSVMRTNLTEGFGYSGGYSFSPDFVAIFDIFAARLVQMAQDGHIDFNQQKRQDEIAKIRDSILARYPGLYEVTAMGKAA